MKNKVSYIFLKTLAVFSLIFFIVSIFFIKNIEEIYKDEINSSIKVDLEHKSTTLKNILIDIKKDITLLSNSYENDKKSLAYFLTFKNEFSNAKIIKINNKELLTIPDYTNFKNLEKDELFFSNIKLKKVNDILLKPRVEIVDIITPIFNKTGEKIAYLIVEYNMKTIFDRINSNTSDIETLFLNNQNYILNSKIEEENFGFLFGKEPTFNNINNLMYKQIDSSSISNIDWKIATISNDSKINNKIENYLDSLSWIVFLYFLLAIFISYFFAEYKHNDKVNKLRLKISNNVFENSHEGIIITNHENKIIQVNKVLHKLLDIQKKRY